MPKNEINSEEKPAGIFGDYSNIRILGEDCNEAMVRAGIIFLSQQGFRNV